jgi:hypothetical protein
VDSDAVALWSLIVSSVATIMACLALVVAILDWQQVTREEAWSLEKLDSERWRLRRNHRSRVFITSAGVFHHSGVQWVNDAGIPGLAFRRGTTAVLRIAPDPRGCSLTLTVAKARRGEVNNRYRAYLSLPLQPKEKFVELPLY